MTDPHEFRFAAGKTGPSDMPPRYSSENGEEASFSAGLAAEIDEAKSEKWTVDEVCIWAYDNHLKADFFRNNQIDGAFMRRLDDQQLMELGMTLKADRVRTMVKIEKLIAKYPIVVVRQPVPTPSAPAPRSDPGYIETKDIEGLWVCFCFPIFWAMFQKTRRDDNKLTHTGCCFIGPWPCLPFSEDRLREGNSNGFYKIGDEKNVDYYLSKNCVCNGISCSRKLCSG